MAKSKTVYICQDCGKKHSKWQGKCSGCGEWNKLVEEVEMSGKALEGTRTILRNNDLKPEKLKDIKEEDVKRFLSGYSEFDRVLGGGIVEGSMVLIGGEPGQGKSTLLLQVATHLSRSGMKILYFTGEESKFQTKLRAVRLHVGDSDMYVMHTRNIEDVERFCETETPDLIIVDSIQTTGDPNLTSEPGSIAQVKMATARLMTIAKQNNVTTFIIGQVNKEGGVAGPKTLEHMVDTVLFLEGEPQNDLRILRAIKNRFGQPEMGIFKMEGEGLVEIINPSEYLLENRLKTESGSAIVCISDTRPLLVEVQCLVSPPVYKESTPRRTAEGFSRNRMTMLSTVLERRGDIPLTSADIYVNVIGGIPIKERSADLGVLMAMYSSHTDNPIDNLKTQTVFLGEVGLTGEVRGVANVERLVMEAERTGFTHCVLPTSNFKTVQKKVSSIKLIPVSTLREAISKIFKD